MSMFLGHVSSFTGGTIYPLPQYRNKKSLSVTNGYQLVNNICPHQGSLILTEPSEQLSCRYHGWSWDVNGKPLTQGSTTVCNRSEISMSPVYQENGLLFTKPVDLAPISAIDLTHMRLVETRIDSVHCDWRNIVDVFLDVDHIPVVHRDVYDSIGITTADVEWDYYDWGSIQRVSKSAEYSDEYRSTLLNIEEEQLAAWWVTVYPGTMIEWQPGAMFVTQCIERGDVTDVLVSKYRDSRYSDHNWQLNSTIWETAWQQDREQSESIVIPHHKIAHLEPQKIHFREWMKSD